VEFEDAEPKSGLEVTAASFFTEADLARLSSGHDRRVSLLFRQLTREAPVPYFDV